MHGFPSLFFSAALLYTLGLLSLIFWARRRNIWARKVAAEMPSQGGR
jgi:hypothetical protein